MSNQRPEGTRGSSKPARAQRGLVARLEKLPRLPEVVVAGGKRRLGVYFREGRQLLQPQLALWIEPGSGFIRTQRLISPSETEDDGVTQALEALVEALTMPMAAFPAFLGSPAVSPGAPRKRSSRSSPKLSLPQTGLPGRIEVNDQPLAEAARDLLAPLDVTVEYVESIPIFDELFKDLSSFMGADEQGGPPEPFTWEIDEGALPALYRAAAGYWRRAPWEYLGSDIPVAIELGERGPRPDVSTLYAVVLGNAGEVFGLAFYYSLASFRRSVQLGEEQLGQDMEMNVIAELLRRSGVPVDEIPPRERQQLLTETMKELGLSVADEQKSLEAIGDGLVMFFDHEEESDPTYLDWLDERELKRASRDAVPTFLRLAAHSEPSLPNEREVRAMALAIEALNRFFSARRDELDALSALYMRLYSLPEVARVSYTARIADPQAEDSRLSIEMKMPPEGWSSDRS